MSYFSRILLLVITPLLWSCSTTTDSTIATVDQVIRGDNDVVMTSTQIKQLPYASAYIRVGDNPQAFVVLAYADKNGNLSWVSADHHMFITRAGRLIKTVGLDNDLLSISSDSADPLLKVSTSHVMSWPFQAEWKKDYVSGYRLLSRLRLVEKTTISLLDEPRETWLFEETIQVEHSGNSWKNYYWVNTATGLVVKSEQRLGPNLPVIEMTILKPYTP